jgi:hypothetical protein
MDGSTKESCCPLQLAASSNPRPHNLVALSHYDRNQSCRIPARYNDPQEWAVVQGRAGWVLVLAVLVLAVEMATVDHHQ